MLDTDAPVAAENVPARHEVHTLVREAPAVTEYVPCWHATQSAKRLAPVVRRYVPAAQFVQLIWPAAI